jgi:hypothetical protein
VVGLSLRVPIRAELIYELPLFANLSNAVARQILGGWRVASIFNGQTGQPINITQISGVLASRPDYIGGEAVLDDYNSTRQYLDRSAFALVPIIGASRATARPGNIGYGAIRGPGAWNVDISMAKDFRVTERVAFQLRTDMFNAVNNVNLTGLVTNINTTATFGQLRGTRGQRVVQLNGRIMW